MKRFSLLQRVSILKTLFTNFRLLPMKQALKLPILVGRYTTLEFDGEVILDFPVRPGVIRFGIGGSPDLYKYNPRRNYLGLQKGGKIIFHGPAHFARHSLVLAGGVP